MVQKVMAVAAFALGCALLVLGAVSHSQPELVVGAAMALPAMLASGFGAKVLEAAPKIEEGLETAEKFLPLVPFLPPAYQAVAHAILDDTDAALKALERANAERQPGPVAQAQAAGADAAKDPAKVL